MIGPWSLGKRFLSDDQIETIIAYVCSKTNETIMTPHLYEDEIRALGIDLEENEKITICKCLKLFPGAVFFDIGTSLGLWSFLALGNNAKQVIAFDGSDQDNVPRMKNYEKVPRLVGLEPNLEIDKFVQERKIIPDFIKIDVEGMEMDVLQGGLETIKKYKPSIMVESHDHLAVGRKEEVQSLLNPILGKPVDITEQHSGSTFIHHLIYVRSDVQD